MKNILSRISTFWLHELDLAGLLLKCMPEYVKHLIDLRQVC